MTDQPPLTHSPDVQQQPQPPAEAVHPPINVDRLSLYADAARPPGQAPLSPAQINAQIEAYRSALAAWADKSLPNEQTFAPHQGQAMDQKFKADMAAFEKRAAAEGLSKEEVLKTYQQIARLTQLNGDHWDAFHKDSLVCDAMAGVAGAKVNQGATLACNVACVQDRTNALSPAESSRLIADAATTGEYRAADGTVVKVDISKLGGFPIDEDGRNLYERIWQTTAVNLHYVQENARTGQDVHYEQQSSKGFGDSGERLVDYSKHPPEVKNFEGLNPIQIAGISNAITGRNEKDVVLVQANAYPGAVQDGPGVTIIHSDKELADKLAELKRNNKLPTIVAEYGPTEPFYTDGGSSLSDGARHWQSHVVTITDYDPNAGQVAINNSEGKDYTLSNNLVSVHDLDVAMQVPAAAEKAVASYVDRLREKNTEPGKSQQTVKSTEQFVNEVQFLRLQITHEEITGTAAEQKVQTCIAEAAQREKSGRLNEKQAGQEMQELENTISCLPPDARVRCYRSAHQSGLIDDKEYYITLKLVESYEKGSVDSMPLFQRLYTSTFSDQAFRDELARSFAELPPGMGATDEEMHAVMLRRHFYLR